MSKEAEEYLKENKLPKRWRGEDELGEFMYYESNIIEIMQSYANLKVKEALEDKRELTHEAYSRGKQYVIEEVKKSLIIRSDIPTQNDWDMGFDEGLAFQRNKTQAAIDQLKEKK